MSKETISSREKEMSPANSPWQNLFASGQEYQNLLRQFFVEKREAKRVLIMIKNQMENETASAAMQRRIVVYNQEEIVQAVFYDLAVRAVFVSEIKREYAHTTDSPIGALAQKLIERDEEHQALSALCILEPNLQRLVAAMARRYEGHGVPFEDLQQEELIELTRNLDRFNPNWAMASTFFYYYFRRALNRCVDNQGYLIRRPSYVDDQIKRLEKAEEKLISDLERTPTDEELAAVLDQSAEQVAFLRAARLTQKAVSLDAALKNDEKATLYDLLLAKQWSPEDRAVNKVQKEQIRAAVEEKLSRMTNLKIATNLRAYFGLGQPAQNMREIADEEGVSYQNIDRRLKQGLEKLKEALRPFQDEEGG